MMRALQILAGAIVGGGIAATSRIWRLHSTEWTPPRLPFPPDAQAVLVNNLAAGQIDVAAGAVAGASVAAFLHTDEKFLKPLILMLAMFNPAAVFAMTSGAQVSLFFTSVLIAAAAFAKLAADRDHVSATLLGLAMAAAPFFASSVLFLYPALLITAGLLSPWGFALTRLAGFYFVLLTPLALVLIAVLYLYWLFSIPFSGVTEIDSRKFLAPEAGFLGVGALLLALAFVNRPKIAALTIAAVLAGVAYVMLVP